MIIRTERSFCFVICISIFLSIAMVNVSCAATSPSSGQLLKDIGTYYSPQSSFKVIITVSSIGGFKICQIMDPKKQIHRIDDINGLIWINETEVIYSVSPIYGKPGIYIFNCKEKIEKMIIHPKVLNSAYPNGADYFELKGYDRVKREISYYYTPDIDSVNFKNFRNKKNVLKRRLE